MSLFPLLQRNVKEPLEVFTLNTELGKGPLVLPPVLANKLPEESKAMPFILWPVLPILVAVPSLGSIVTSSLPEVPLICKAAQSRPVVGSVARAFPL